MNTSFLHLLCQEPSIELQLSVELRSREIENSDDIEEIKKYCIALLKSNAYKDEVLANLLGFIADFEARKVAKQVRKKKKWF